VDAAPKSAEKRRNVHADGAVAAPSSPMAVAAN
jgi:hypothetical protein